MKPAVALVAFTTVTFLLGSTPVLALDPSLDVSQYAHTAWTVRDGFSLGNIYAIAQTPDGYLWLGTEFGLFRFDGIHSVPWQPPAGQQLPALHKELLETIRAVHAGDALTPAEVRVLRLIADGNANKEIAEQLSVSEETVKGQVRNMLRVVAGIALAFHAAMALRSDPPIRSILRSILLDLLAGTVGILLLVGLWTPITGTIVTILALCSSGESAFRPPDESLPQLRHRQATEHSWRQLGVKQWTARGNTIPIR